MRLLTMDGTTQPIKDWALDYGISANLIRWRLKDGWSVERAITEPMRAKPGERLRADGSREHRRKPHLFPKGTEITLNGKTLSIRQWAAELGAHHQTITYRLRTGWPIERALTTPPATIPGPQPQIIEFRGETLCVKQWAARIGIKECALRSRLRNPAWTLEAALTKGKLPGGRPPRAA